MKTKLAIATFAIAFAATSVAAQEKTRERSYEGENVSASSKTTVDREAGILTREGSATNKNTGNTASRSLDRRRTDTGSTISRSSTGFGGRTSSLEGERVRSDNGSTFNGTKTTRGGREFGLFGTRSRDGMGNSSASQRVTNSNGANVYSRDRVTTRTGNTVNRSVNTSRQRRKRPQN